MKKAKRESWVPKYVYKGRSAWEYRPIRNGVNIRLCALDSPKTLVIRRHAEEFEKFHTKQNTLKAMAGLYFKSGDFIEKKPRTQSDYRKYWEKLEPVFGHMDVNKITAPMFRRYMDTKGQKSKTQANRHRSLMSKIYSWGVQRGHANTNPIAQTSRFSEKARDRYITDEEYNAIYEHACDRVKVAMEISYLCAAREGDVIKLKKMQLLDEGIKIKQGKTDKVQIKRWNTRLRQAIELSKTLKTGHASIFVIPTRTGTAYTEDGFRTMWSKAKAKARKETGLDLGNLHFHDIKAKSISDKEGTYADKQQFSGHSNASMIAIYDRKVQVVDALDTDQKSDP